MCASADDREERNVSYGKSARPEVYTKVSLCLLPLTAEKGSCTFANAAERQLFLQLLFQAGDFPMRCWVAAAVSQRRWVPEGVGLFAETDWQSSPYVSWELLVKLDSALSITIKAIPTCGLHSSYASWSKTTATFNCLCFPFLFSQWLLHPKQVPDPWVPLPVKACGWPSLWVTKPAASSSRISSLVKQWVQTGSASFCASGQAPVYVVNCFNSNNKPCGSDDLRAFLY